MRLVRIFFLAFGVLPLTSCSQAGEEEFYLVVLPHNLETLEPDRVMRIGLRGWLRQEGESFYLEWQEERFDFATSDWIDACAETLVGADVTIFGQFDVNQQRFESFRFVEEFRQTDELPARRCDFG